jgi:hypothetical protein
LLRRPAGRLAPGAVHAKGAGDRWRGPRDVLGAPGAERTARAEQSQAQELAPLGARPGRRQDGEQPPALRQQQGDQRAEHEQGGSHGHIDERGARAFRAFRDGCIVRRSAATLGRMTPGADAR